MKLVFKIYLAALAVMTCACSDLTEMNVNPASASKMDPNLQLSYVQHYDACYKRSMSIYMIYPGGWNNHFTNYSSMVTYGSKGVYKSDYSERLWTQNYPNVIKNVVDMYENSEVGTNLSASRMPLRSSNMIAIFAAGSFSHVNVSFSNSQTKLSPGASVRPW